MTYVLDECMLHDTEDDRCSSSGCLLTKATGVCLTFPKMDHT